MTIPTDRNGCPRLVFPRKINPVFGSSVPIIPVRDPVGMTGEAGLAGQFPIVIVAVTGSADGIIPRKLGDEGHGVDPIATGAIHPIGIEVGVVRMAIETGDAGEPAHEIRSVALRGAVALSVIQDVLPMFFLLLPITFMGIKGMTGGASGGDFRLIGRLFMALEAGLGAALEDANTVGGGAGPTARVWKDIAGRSKPCVNSGRRAFPLLRASEEEKEK